MDILSVSIRNDISSNGYQLEYCCGISPMVNQVSVYCRSGSELEIRLTKLQQQHPTAIWLTSDLTALVKTALETGFQLTQVPLIDLTAEAKMLMLTHPKYQSADLSIENAYHVFNVKLETSHSHRQTILFKRVLDLLNATLQDSIRTNAIIQQMVIRGEYIKAIVKLDKQGAGFPIDQDKLNDWFVNQADTIDKIQQKVNDVYGEIYVTTSDNKGRKLSHERLKLLANINNIPWQTWGNGSYLNLDKSYLKELANHHPDLTMFYQSITFINAINSSDLRQLSNDGYIKPSLFLMSQKTGRNSPKPSEGYLLNAGAWIRSLITPKPDHCVIAIDWCQQEIGIAAVLSGDQKLMQTYNTVDGDVYIALAKQAGFAPPSATKYTHPEVRQIFKTVQIGLGYGKTVWSLAKDIKAISTNLSMAQAYNKAQQIHDWHKETFSAYWQWINAGINRAREQRFMQSQDGWTYFVDDRIKDTQLLNFPMQSNGAALMRLAITELAKYDDIDFICTQHDAIYVNATVTEQSQVIDKIQTAMDFACNELFDGKLLLRTEVSIYHENNPIIQCGDIPDILHQI